MNNVCILVSGASGTGKSTIQRLAPSFFRANFGEVAAFGTDEIYQIVDPDWSHNSERLRAICKDNCIHLARNLFRNGISVVLIAGNALYDWRDVNDYVQALEPLSSIYHFTLTVPSESVYERVTRRGDVDVHPQAWLADWLRHVERHVGPWTHMIDTSQCTPEDALQVVLQRIQAGLGSLNG